MSTTISKLDDILKALKQGDLRVLTNENYDLVNKVTIEMLGKTNHDQKDIVKIGIVIAISNILYNNTSITTQLK